MNGGQRGYLLFAFRANDSLGNAVILGGVRRSPRRVFQRYVQIFRSGASLRQRTTGKKQVPAPRSSVVACREQKEVRGNGGGAYGASGRSGDAGEEGRCLQTGACFVERSDCRRLAGEKKKQYT